MKGIAYIILGFFTLGMTAFYIVDTRHRLFAAVDRRLAALTPAGIPIPSRLVPVSLPDLLVPLLARAQVEVTGERLRLLGWMLLAAALIALVAIGPIAAVAVLAGLPLAAHAWLTARARKRIDGLIDALPHFIDAVRQLQAVGNSLSQAIERALADAPAPMQSYFAVAGRRLEMGAPIAETIQQLADRLRIPEISMLAAAIRTNLRYGGSIATVLRNLANILRDRARVRMELKAATSEAKVSSRVLIAMPLVAMAMLVAMNPGYISFFTEDSRGHTLAFVAFGFEGLGILVLRRLLRLDF